MKMERNEDLLVHGTLNHGFAVSFLVTKDSQRQFLREKKSANYVAIGMYMNIIYKTIFNIGGLIFATLL